MTKEQYLAHLTAIYRAANLADSDHPEPWMKPQMAGRAGCATIDKLLHSMVDVGVLTNEEHQSFLDNL